MVKGSSHTHTQKSTEVPGKPQRHETLYQHPLRAVPGDHQPHGLGETQHRESMGQLSGAPHRLGIPALGDRAPYRMQGKSMLGLCKTYYRMFRGETKGWEKEGLMWFGEEKMWENREQTASKGPAAHKKVSGQYVCLAMQQSVLSS